MEVAKTVVRLDKIISDIMETIKNLPANAIIDISKSLMFYAEKIKKEEEKFGKLDTKIIS